jgi:hypothetical protein
MLAMGIEGGRSGSIIDGHTSNWGSQRETLNPGVHENSSIQLSPSICGAWCYFFAPDVKILKWSPDFSKPKPNWPAGRPVNTLDLQS